MRVLLPAIFLCLATAAGAAASFAPLTPKVIGSGGVALLRWQGEEPALALARFNGRSIPLRATAAGAEALLGVDLEMAAGSYPVLAVAVDRRGVASFYLTAIEVRKVERPVERLSLPKAMASPKDPKLLERIGTEWSMMKELFARRTSASLWDFFVLPVADPVGSVFGLGRVLNGEKKSPHGGTDFRSPRGTPVAATASGRVAFAGELYYTGRTVVLDHGDGLFSLYAHLETFRCAEGGLVARGELLGTVGSTGRSTGAHLHWGMKLRGDRIDPMALLEVSGGGKSLTPPAADGNNYGIFPEGSKGPDLTSGTAIEKVVKMESFESALKALEEAVDRLESGELSLEESLNCFENGVKSTALCRKLLGDVEARVDVLLKERGGELTVEEFDEE